MRKLVLSAIAALTVAGAASVAAACPWSDKDKSAEEAPQTPIVKPVVGA